MIISSLFASPIQITLSQKPRSYCQGVVLRLRTRLNEAIVSVIFRAVHGNFNDVQILLKHHTSLGLVNSCDALSVRASDAKLTAVCISNFHAKMSNSCSHLEFDFPYYIKASVPLVKDKQPAF